MKILLTGSHGFIGSHLFAYFTRKGYEIQCLKHDNIPTSPKGDFIIHCAISNGFDNYKSDRHFFSELVHEGIPMIYFGSGAEFGKENDLWLQDEKILPINISNKDEYSGFKRFCNIYTWEENNLVNLRLFGCCGEGELPTRFFRSIIEEALLKHQMTIKEPGKMLSWIDVTDLCAITESFLLNWDTLKYREYNLANHELYTNLDWAIRVAELLHRSPKMVLMDKSPKPRYTASIERYCQQYQHFAHPVSFTPMDMSIARMIKYYQHELKI